MPLRLDTSSLVTELNSRSTTTDSSPTDSTCSASSSTSTIIGTGTCGTIFAGGEDSPLVAIKVGKYKGGLEQDWSLLKKTNQAFQLCSSTLFLGTPHHGRIPCLPAHFEYFTQAEIVRLLPASYHRDNYAYSMERIQSFSVKARRTLLDMFPSVQLKVEDTHDCLIRPYLGEKLPADGAGPSNLQNVPLYLDQMIVLGLDCRLMAQEMAVGLAILHWEAKIDAIDVEFVLGASRTNLSAPWQSGNPHDIRNVSMWVLDFDKAATIELNESMVVKRLAGGMQGNDNYFPKPDLDQDVWAKFKESYLDASDHILRQSPDNKATILSLPQQVLDEYCQMHKARQFQVDEWDPFERDGDDDEDEEDDEEGDAENDEEGDAENDEEGDAENDEEDDEEENESEEEDDEEDESEEEDDDEEEDEILLH
ncbi:hypothetical protein F5Y16DRAFT_403976 [Xylariaceae sp. FL0255]|nr:hypothetical protein F5Y16DRAFT_403976 [Xylariaceae sp. FL0255]